MISRFFDMFSGIGGFSLGIQGVGSNQNSDTNNTWQCATGIQSGFYNKSQRITSNNEEQSPTSVGYAELDKYAAAIYRHHFPEHKGWGDATKIEWAAVPDFDLLCAGFPCQAFSIAGKRQGFDDVRGTLFFEIVRCAQEKQPCLLLLENVKGLLSHDKGRTFGTILNTLDECGYDLQWQVLNSKNFGVPQNRERVFIIGHLKRTARPEIFPVRKANEIYPGKHEEDNIAQCLDSNYHKGWLDHGQQTMIIQRPHGKNKGGFKQLPCLRASSFEHNDFLKEDCGIRRLMPIECERLQGFPDNWTQYGDFGGEIQPISDTQRYKCLGNAVTVNVIEWIMGQWRINDASIV